MGKFDLGFVAEHEKVRRVARAAPIVFGEGSTMRVVRWRSAQDVAEVRSQGRPRLALDSGRPVFDQVLKRSVLDDTNLVAGFSRRRVWTAGVARVAVAARRKSGYWDGVGPVLL